MVVLVVVSFVTMKQPVVFLSLFVGIFVGLIGLFVHHDRVQSFDALMTELLWLYTRSDFNFAGETMPMTALTRQAIDREISFLVMNIPQLVLYHKRSALYFPFIEDALEKNTMPDDLKYLAVAESALKPDALSTASALGIRQFIPDTAKQYGLRIDQYVDERMHFEKSTEAALAYLRKAYETFGNRTLAAASYNRGMGGIQRALDNQRVRSYYDLELNSETARYVYRIVVIKYAMQIFDRYYDSDLYGAVYDPPSVRSVALSGPIASVYDWLSWSSTSPSELFFYNPWLTSTEFPDWSWNVLLSD